MIKVTLVGGGTAGHVEPALAVGRWLEANNSEIDCEFVGTASGIEKDLLPKTNFKFHKIIKSPVPRKISLSLFAWPFRILLSTIQGLWVIRNSKLVIGFGGYVSAPIYFAAFLRRTPIIIHEANAKPGWANRLGAHLTKNLTIAFSGAKAVGGAWSNALVVGMPIRSEIIEVANLQPETIADMKASAAKEFDLNPNNKTILVFGGSQGAKKINRAIAEALPNLLKSGFNLIHSVGRGNPLPEKQFGYAPLTYIENMAQAYAVSDLVISRSGAVSCAEIAAANRFAVLVPLPIGNGEQAANAQELVKNQRALICSNEDFDGDWLISNIPALKSRAGSNLSSVSSAAKVPADAMIGEIVLKILSKDRRSH